MSPAAALTRELFDRGRWSHPAAALGALAFPVMILTALAHEGGLDPNDKSTLIMHLVLVQFNILSFGASLLTIQWKLSSLYAYPATTATLVTWRLLPPMAAMFVETIAWTAALNAMYGLDWPLWGPALFSAVAYVAIASAVWFTLGSRWMMVAIGVVGSILGIWLKLRYGGLTSDPTHMWNQVTPTEAFTLLAFAAVAYGFAIIGVAHSRRGEPPFTLGLIAWLDRLVDRAPAAALRPFRSPMHAQFWHDWRQGWLAPLYVLAILSFGLVVWLFTERDPQDLVFGVAGIASFLLAGSMINGVMFGNVSPRSDLIMGQFLATRPATTPLLAYSILRTAALSLLLAWLIWALALAAAWATLAALATRPLALYDFSEIDARLILAAFVGSWIIVGTMISVSLTGRSKAIVLIFLISMTSYIGIMLAAKFTLSPPAQQQLNHALAVLAGATCFVATLATFLAARRRRLIEPPTAWAALAAWAVLVITASLLVPPALAPRPIVYTLVFGLLSLAVIPFAAAPLALSWNRHR